MGLLGGDRDLERSDLVNGLEEWRSGLEWDREGLCWTLTRLHIETDL